MLPDVQTGTYHQVVARLGDATAIRRREPREVVPRFKSHADAADPQVRTGGEVSGYAPN